MGLDLAQFREALLRPTLQSINLWSESAENLLLGTAICESSLVYLKQMTGPALSIYGIEPFTYNDLRTRLIVKYPTIRDNILQTLNMSSIPSNPNYLIGNITAAIIFARLKYYMCPDPLPDAKNAMALAEYYKKIYNTADGAASVNVAAKIFLSVVVGYPFKPTVSNLL